MTNEEKILEMLGTMQEDLTRVNDRLGRLETAQTQMQEDLDTVKTAQAQMQEDITRINVTLEVKIAKEIQFLADGHMGIIEQLHKLDDIEKKLEDVSVQVDAIRPTVKEHTRELAQMKRVQ